MTKLQHQYCTKRNDHNVLHSVLPDGFVFRFVHKELISKEICWAEHDNMSIQPLPIDMIPNNI
jgi:hypothetical protein